jgi:oxalate decarboxylase/phosphoglucose isomerase-like protein (cupin superfamily)
MTLFASTSNARTFDYQAGDIGYVPASFGMSPEVDGTTVPRGDCLPMPINLGHYVENIGNKTLHYLEIFNTGEFLTVFAIDHWS